MEFQITAEQIKRKVPVTVFHLSGTLDIACTETFEKQARQAVEGGMRYLLLDFKNVDAVRSAGLRSVQLIYKMLAPKAAEENSREPVKNPYLKLVNLSPEVFYVFDISGFLRNIAAYNDSESALDSFE